MVTMDFATLVVAFEVALMISMVVNATKEARVSRIGSFLLGGAAARSRRPSGRDSRPA